MTETEARDEICRVGASLFARGYVHGSAGNISVRLDDAQGGGYLVTPTDACLGTLDPAHLARLDASLQQTAGDRASKTALLHARIHGEAARFDPATCCVIHTHATHCVSLSLRRLQAAADDRAPSGSPAADDTAWLPPITPYFVMKVGRVPLLGPHRPGAAEAADAAGRAIRRHGAAGAPIRAVMLARLGPVVWHDAPATAMATLEELEETARLCLLCGDALAPLDAGEIDELRRHFAARW